VLFEEFEDRLARTHVLVAAPTVVATSWNRYQLIGNTDAIEPLVQTHTLLVGNGRVLVTLNRDDWRQSFADVGKRESFLAKLMRS